MEHSIPVLLNWKQQTHIQLVTPGFHLSAPFFRFHFRVRNHSTSYALFLIRMCGFNVILTKTIWNKNSRTLQSWFFLLSNREKNKHQKICCLFTWGIHGCILFRYFSVIVLTLLLLFLLLSFHFISFEHWISQVSDEWRWRLRQRRRQKHVCDFLNAYPLERSFSFPISLSSERVVIFRCASQRFYL